MHELLSCGLLHSDIHGSIHACWSPWLFAAYHVLLRLLMPRHSPYALISLTIWIMFSSSLKWFYSIIAYCSFYYPTYNFHCLSFSSFALLSSLFNFQATFLLQPLQIAWWAQVDSNHRPHAYQACALTTWAMRPCVNGCSLFPRPFGGDEEDRTPDPLRARQVLSQLSYTPKC